MTLRPTNEADPDLYSTLNTQGDLQPSGRVALEYFMGAMTGRPRLEAAAQSYVTRHGTEGLAELVVANPLDWVVAYFESQ